MNATYVLEKGISRLNTHENEKDIDRRWWTLPLECPQKVQTTQTLTHREL